MPREEKAIEEEQYAGERHAPLTGRKTLEVHGAILCRGAGRPFVVPVRPAGNGTRPTKRTNLHRRAQVADQRTPNSAV
jgi:hypothetical protein